MFSIIAFLMALGTAIDAWQQLNPYPTLAIKKNDDKQESFLLQMLKCFSINLNGKQVLKTEMGKGAVECLSGMRFISMAWIVLGHLYMFATMFFTENPWLVEEVIKSYATKLWYFSSMFSVDPF